MRLVVGLGNPGSRHARNRHNIGFMAAAAIARRYGFSAFRSRFKGELSEGVIAGERRLLLLPQTFMNASGESVLAAMSFYKIPPGEIVVIHDELDLRPGKMRVKRGGGSAGHNGLRSIDSMIGPDYWRIRIGIGHPGMRELVHPYVLMKLHRGGAAVLGRAAGRCDSRDDPLVARRRARCVHERGRAPVSPGPGTR